MTDADETKVLVDFGTAGGLTLPWLVAQQLQEVMDRARKLGAGTRSDQFRVVVGWAYETVRRGR